ncbi:hypothetical protein XELAEV_18017923mg [Xenopus laevis]|uniref:Uncharacterized protein n=1 Tax=Xenopus laevis TaxID=8355 RepID=A0A974DCK9_XENLA|nr:hypothetical protein XELAEV_18017923mg [Xenopus laevis]
MSSLVMCGSAIYRSASNTNPPAPSLNPSQPAAPSLFICPLLTCPPLISPEGVGQADTNGWWPAGHFVGQKHYGQFGRG